MSIGIAIAGTATGMAIGNYYQKQAQAQYELADRQKHLLQSFESAVLQIRSHPQTLFSVLEDSIWFEYETSKFTGDILQAQEILSELTQFEIENYDRMKNPIDNLFTQIIFSLKL